ncbi:hypothetical protein RDV89_10270 [Nocardioides zeae]|uniref:Tryptophan-rich sensory protein n=1 Tax=Nocardioides imazamoxiresistens TaxID=3231893 RepID=A0ABU3PX45_9ACTN|nr:hypothetical protein [Nocardioides zeae]MDT9593451.1 hypothetical protein [Nocardioides zeae]
MTTPSAPAAVAPVRPAGTRPLAWVVLGASVLQVAAPAVSIGVSGDTPGAGSAPDLLVSPAGWAFGIWGVIYLLAIAQAVGALVAGPGGLPRRLQLDQVLLYASGALWIAMSALGSSLATAAALALMLAAAVDGVLVVARSGLVPRWLARLSRAAVGLYAGWVTAAFFLNLGTALVEVGAFDVGGLGWQLVLLAGAAVVLAALAYATRVVAYVVAGIWALGGITATGLGNDDPGVWGLAVAAAAVIGAALVAGIAAGRAGRSGSPVRPGRAARPS